MDKKAKSVYTSGMNAILLLLALHSHAADAGRLVHAKGDVTLETAGAGRLVKTGAAVPTGSILSTGGGAAAIVELPDGSRLKLRESSRVRLTLPGARSPRTEVELTRGSVFARITKRLAGSEFSVRAGTAVAAVRGTEFFTAFGRPGGDARDVWVCVGKGLVDVSAAGKTRPVREGEGVLIPGGSEVGKPKFYPWTKTLNWNMDPASGETEDATKLDAAYADLLDQDYR